MEENKEIGNKSRNNLRVAYVLVSAKRDPEDRYRPERVTIVKENKLSKVKHARKIIFSIVLTV